LTAAVRSARSDHVDHEEIGRYWLEQATVALSGMRKGEAPLPTPPLDLRFADLVADPLGVADQVCDYIGVPLTDEARRRMTAFVEAPTDATPGRHQYAAAMFGLSERELEDRFGDYVDEFDL
jgi:hypothetical protein